MSPLAPVVWRTFLGVWYCLQRGIAEVLVVPQFPLFFKETEVKIFKYPLEITDKQTINLPHDSHVLSVQFQNDVLCLWAAVNTDVETQPYRVIIVGTGHEVSRLTLHLHLATVQQNQMVWHVFGKFVTTST